MDADGKLNERNFFLFQKISRYWNLDVKVLFSLFDVDGNGQLKGNEIRDLISLIGGSHVNDEDLAKVTQFIDTNGIEVCSN